MTMIKKHVVSRKAQEKFDIDEWMIPEVSLGKSKKTLPDGKIKYRSLKPDANGRKYSAFMFNNSIYDMLNPGEEKRVMVMKHRSDPNRIVMFRSANGYKAVRPTSCKHFIIKITNSNDIWPNVDEALCDTIFHPKGIGSATVIEFAVNDSGDK